MIKNLIWVGLGGGLGSMLRYLSSLWVHKHYSGTFPLATFLINILGCLCMGLFIGWASRYVWMDETWKLLCMVGFCGGYTTFSAFSAENLQLLEAGHYFSLILYVGASVLLGLLVLWGAYALAR